MLYDLVIWKWKDVEEKKKWKHVWLLLSLIMQGSFILASKNIQHKFSMISLSAH